MPIWENPEIPLAGTVAPPFLHTPYACTNAVTAGGAIEGAVIQLLHSNGNTIDQYTETTDVFGSAVFQTSKQIEQGDRFYAIQIANGVTSAYSNVVIARYRTEPLPKPVLTEGIWECGLRIHQRFAENGIPIQAERDGNSMSLPYHTSIPTSKNGTAHAFQHNNETPVGTAGENVVIFQEICPEDAQHRVTGPRSEPELISTAPSPLPNLNIMKAFAGTNQVYIGGVFTGEDQRWNHINYSTRALGYAPYNYNLHLLNLIIDENEPLEVTRQLCGTEWTTQTFEPISVGEVEQLIPTPSISGPVCENATFVDVSTTFPAGRFVVYDGSKPVAQASANGGSARVGIPPIQNTMISVRQMLYSGFLGPVATTYVDKSTRLEILNGGRYVDQNDSSIVYDPAVLREGEGVWFRLSECCDNYNDLPTSLTAQIGETRVMMYLTHDGNYEGKWDFRTEDIIVPTINEDYQMIVHSPCNNEELILDFSVVTGEIDPNDSNNPITYVRADQAGRASSDLLDSNSTVGDDYLVEPGAPTTIRFGGSDTSGIQRVVVSHAGAGILSDGVRQAQLIAPLPTNLGGEAFITPIEPYQIATVQATGLDFAGNSSSTPTLTLTGEHMRPVINTITPDPVGANGSITISGQYLTAGTLETRVVFDAVSESITETIALPPGPSVSPNQLANIAIPAAFTNYLGQVDVTVITKNFAGIQEESSNPKRIELIFIAEGGPATFYSFSQFTDTISGANKCTGSSAPGAISSISFAGSTPGPHIEFRSDQVSVTSNGRTESEVIPFKTKVPSSQGSGIGGIIVTPNCRNVLVFNYDGSDLNGEEDWTFIAFYFPPSGPVVTRNFPGANRQYLVPGTSGDILTFADYAVYGGSSPDGSVVFLQNTGTGVGTPQSLPSVKGHMIDFVPNPKIYAGSTSICSSVSSCAPSASVATDGLSATMKVAGTHPFTYSL